MVIGKPPPMSERKPDQPAPAPAGTPVTTRTDGPAIDPPPALIGHGYDLHRLEVRDQARPVASQQGARPLVVGGVTLESDRGPVAHSDGDALLHAITDALLGAIAAPDLGSFFPDNDPANDGRNSAEFLAEALRRVKDAGYRLANIDATVILERPRLSPHRAAIRAHLATLLGLPVARVNLKGKSHEGLDAIGEGRAIEAHAVALLTLIADA